MERHCYFCKRELTEDIFAGDDESYPFCDRCIAKLELLDVDLDEAERKLRP